MELIVFLGSLLSHSQLFFLLLATFLFCFVVATLLLSRAKLPPGPWSLPIIGHLHLLGDLPHQSFYKLSRIHGPLMSLRLGSTVAIVASTPEMAREILQTHDQAFASRPRTAATVHLLFDCSDIAFTPIGPYWKLIRQICATHLFSNKRMEGFRPVRVEEVGSLLRSVLDDTGGATGHAGRQMIVVRPKLLATTNNIISRMTLGKRFSELSSRESSHNMVALLNEALELLGLFNLGDYIPFLAGLDLQGYVRRMKMNNRRLTAVLQEVIDGRRDERRATPCDLLDVLLSVSSTHNITDDNIKGIVLDMFLAATDSSALTVEWALAELLTNPTTMKKVQEELDSVVGKSRLVQESDISHLLYLHAVVKETMRLHPVGSLLIPHESIQACRIGGYLVPAKARAYVNVWAIGRDPEAWENPLVFLPERFLESSMDLISGKQFQLLPFGSGRRGCPGSALGLLHVYLMLANLVHYFDWPLPSSNPCGSKVDLSERFAGLNVIMANPLTSMPTPRLPPNIILSNNVGG